MQAEDFDFELPAELIAQRPRPRGESRLLFLGGAGQLQDHQFGELPQLLRRGDRLVVNDTRVLAARLLGRRAVPGEPPGGRIEALLIERLAGDRWWAMLKPGRRARVGGRLVFRSLDRLSLLHAEIEDRDAERFQLRFQADLDQELDRFGRIPLPPYIRRPDDERDRKDYQTAFARVPGAIAAPTAGLHFTAHLAERLRHHGIEMSTITLHVGPATFRPVKSERISDHILGSERFSIGAKAAAEINATRQAGGRIVAVGTTSVRALESAAKADGSLEETSGSTDLFVLPGHTFRAVDLLITNFHLPRSTLLMLVSAFAGKERTLAAYQAAVSRGYRFYSYGDAMLVEAPRMRQAQAAAP